MSQDDWGDSDTEEKKENKKEETGRGRGDNTSKTEVGGRSRGDQKVIEKKE